LSQKKRLLVFFLFFVNFVKEIDFLLNFRPQSTFNFQLQMSYKKYCETIESLQYIVEQDKYFRPNNIQCVINILRRELTNTVLCELLRYMWDELSDSNGLSITTINGVIVYIRYFIDDNYDNNDLFTYYDLMQNPESVIEICVESTDIDDNTEPSKFILSHTIEYNKNDIMLSYVVNQIKNIVIDNIKWSVYNHDDYYDYEYDAYYNVYHKELEMNNE